MNNERGLRGFILARFFIILIIVSLVEFTVVLLTNRFLIPTMISIFKLDAIIQAMSSENLFLIIFVLIVSSIVNSILPFFKLSPAAINSFLEGLIAERGSEAVAATESIRSLTQDTKTTILLALAVIFIAIVLITPYVIGGIIFSISVAKEIRISEKEKEEARAREEKRRYLMISNIVHDLKTPMTTVYGYAKALNDGVVPEDKKSEYLDAIMAKSDRMNDVVAMLLDYVKLDSEGFTIRKERTDICELVRACCAFSFTDIEAAGDEIDVVIPDHPIFIQADNKQLSRVITNLITNAIRHNPEGTKIRVSITSESETTASDVRVFVADSGAEIEGELSEQIFEPFVTGDESRASDAGTGLGLPLSRKICDMHGFTLKLVQNPEILRYRLGEDYKKVFAIFM
ncbi:MAG: HAMP domain-containing histidine kinase [Saccharofermentans sp.]|nr:HAMP domain-containing histidine kinase [Saccharofermentans sp.]